MKRSLLLTIFSVLSCVLVYGQDSVKLNVLTFKDAVDMALKNNVTLNTQKNNLVQTRVQKTYGIAQLGPQVNISGNAYVNDGNTFVQQRAEVVNAVVDVFSAQLSVQMPIFNGLSGVNQMRQFNNMFDAQLHQVKRSTQDVMGLVAQQYLQVLLDMELLRIAQENAAAQKKQLEYVIAQVDLGSRSPVDRYSQQALASNAEVQVAQAEFTITNDKMTLFQTLLYDPSIAISLEEPVWDVNSISLNELSLTQLLDVAAKNRSDLHQVKATEKASRFAMHSRMGNYFPSINAFYNYGSAYNQVRDTPKDDLYRDFGSQFKTDNRYTSFGVAFAIPIFTGFQNRQTYVQAKTQYENTKLLSHSREIIVKSDVVRAYENYSTVKKQYAAGLTGLEAAQSAFNLETERFNLGVTNFVDIANATRIYVQAQTDLAQAKYRFLFQKILLDYATGTLQVEDVTN